MKRPLTRSSVKPRLLFPPAQAGEESKDENDDEEAATDIEDHVLAGMEEESKPETPMELINEAPGTPEAPRYAPASPPMTTRTTRFGSKKAADSSTPMKPQRSGKRSPFDSWRRVKGGSQSSTGHKRSGDELSAAASKRTRA